MKYTVHFETLGCRLNQTETEGAAYSFFLQGFETDLKPLTAQTKTNFDTSNTILSIINTCTVTSKAEQKARRIIRLLLDSYKNAPVIVTGCYAEVEAVSLKTLFPDRVVILKGSSKFLLSKIAEKVKCFISLKNELSAKDLESIIDDIHAEKDKSTKDVFTLYTPIFKKHTRQALKVQDGCNCACSFCRIHIARGKSVSLDVNEAVNRAKALESEGAKEIVLTGVNLSLYAGNYKDDKKASFAELLEELILGTKYVKFKISSFYPQHITESLCAVLASERVQPSFHLSVQSGSDNILEAMKRPYKAETVLKAVDLLRSVKKNPFIACDIIAGFPNESEEDFFKTCTLCKEANFAWIHAFPFSARPGTEAYDMRPLIPERIKGERVKVLNDLAVSNKIAYIEAIAGEPYMAIVENTKDREHIHAVTDNFLHITLDSSLTFRQGNLIRVSVNSPDRDSIINGRENDAFASVL